MSMNSAYLEDTVQRFIDRGLEVAGTPLGSGIIEQENTVLFLQHTR
jgi:hypothetical protein